MWTMSHASKELDGLGDIQFLPVPQISQIADETHWVFALSKASD